MGRKFDQMVKQMQAVQCHLGRISLQVATHPHDSHYKDALAEESEMNAKAIITQLRRFTSLGPEEYDILSSNTQSIEFRSIDHKIVMQALTATYNVARKRAMQCGMKLCQGYFSQSLLNQLCDRRADDDAVAEMLTHFVKLGLINPSEGTSARIAGLVLVIRHGPDDAIRLPQHDLQGMYSDIKDILKGIVKRSPIPPAYVQTYPKDANELLRVHPEFDWVFKEVFSIQNPPCLHAFNMHCVDIIEKKILKRGYDPANRFQRMTYGRSHHASEPSPSPSPLRPLTYEARHPQQGAPRPLASPVRAIPITDMVNPAREDPPAVSRMQPVKIEQHGLFSLMPPDQFEQQESERDKDRDREIEKEREREREIERERERERNIYLSIYIYRERDRDRR